MDNVSMLVVSCDAYTDLGYVFFDLQERFMGWFNDNRYFVNEERDFSYKNVNTIHVGNDCEWSDKVRIAVNSIKTEYILFMLEDYFIGKQVHQLEFQNAIEYMGNNKIVYYRITPTPRIKGESSISDYIINIPYNIRYGVNLQASVFHKEYLLKIVDKEGRNAWQVENDLNKQVIANCKLPIPGCVADNRGIIDIHNAVIKGKWVPKTIQYFKSIGYNIELGDREMMNYIDLLRMQIVGNASHMFSAQSTKTIKKVLRKVGVKFVTD